MPDFYVFNFFPVLAIEVIALRLVKWGNLPTCFLDALVINFATFIGLMLGLGPYISSAKILGLMLFFTYSFLVETAVLCLLERHAVKRCLIAATAANSASIVYLAADSFFTLR